MQSSPHSLAEPPRDPQFPRNALAELIRQADVTDSTAQRPTPPFVSTTLADECPARPALLRRAIAPPPAVDLTTCAARPRIRPKGRSGSTGRELSEYFDASRVTSGRPPHVPQSSERHDDVFESPREDPHIVYLDEEGRRSG